MHSSQVSIFFFMPKIPSHLPWDDPSEESEGAPGHIPAQPEAAQDKNGYWDCAHVLGG